MKKDNIIIGLVVVGLLIVIGIIYVINHSGKLDDWVYKPKSSSNFGIKGTINNQWGSVSADSSIGLSTGGAKDINNYRDNLYEGYFPLQSDITYEGLFYEYFFDTKTNSVNGDEDLFYPSASTSISSDPISNKDEYYLSVGLNSNIKKSDFKRKKLNIVIVLDISGSMSSSIDNYYYDGNYEKKDYKSKMKLAEESINVLIDQLKDYDSLGIVLFDDDAYLAKPLNKMSRTNIKALKKHILEVKEYGGTNFEAGYKKALKVFDKYGIGDTDEYENRIIVITDAMPNIGATTNSELLDMMEDAQDDDINTTFIGVGVDFNSEVVKNITNVRGANYYKVSSEEEFKNRMGEEFDYMVSPMVYDLNMSVDSKNFKLEKIYGTDDINSENRNTIMHVNTLFPSNSTDNGEVKGGIILVKLKKIGKENDLKINLDWNDINDKKSNNSLEVKFKDNNYYDNTGIRKAIVLSRYANMVKDWIAFDRDENNRFLIDERTGIIDYDRRYSSRNERQSAHIRVSSMYRDNFNKLKKYMNNEIKEIDDSTMKQEIEMIDYILNNGKK